MNAIEELQALWADVFGGPPPIRAQPQELTWALVGGLPPAPAYMPQPLCSRVDFRALKMSPSAAETSCGAAQGKDAP